MCAGKSCVEKYIDFFIDQLDFFIHYFFHTSWKEEKEELRVRKRRKRRKIMFRFKRSRCFVLLREPGRDAQLLCNTCGCRLAL